MNAFRIFALVLVLMSAATIAAAQQTPASGDPGKHSEEMTAPRGQDQAVSEEKREEIRKKVEAVRIWKLTEELKLDAATSAKLSSLLSSLDQKRKEVQQEQMAAMRELRSMLKAAKPDESRIKSLLDKLETTHRSMQEFRDREWKSVKEILSPEQQARFFLFQQRFQREMRGMIDGARGRGPAEGGRGSGPGRKHDRRPVEPTE